MDSLHAALKQWIEMDVHVKLIFVYVLCQYSRNLYPQTAGTSWECNFLFMYNVSNIKLMKILYRIFDLQGFSWRTNFI